jgi:nitroreductase
MLPTRTLIARWINGKNVGLVAAGLFLGTWMIAGISHLSVTVILYFLFNWPEEVFVTLIPIIPFENLMRCLIGTVIGTGVIAGLRAIGLVKPAEAIY